MYKRQADNDVRDKIIAVLCISDMVILFFERFKRLFENFLPTHRIDHRHFHAGQFNIGRQNIHAFTVTQDCPAHIIRRIRHLRKQPRGERALQAAHNLC